MAVAVPVAPPKHATSTWLVVTVSAAAGCVIVTLAVAVHKLASVTVTVYGPVLEPSSCYSCLNRHRVP